MNDKYTRALSTIFAVTLAWMTWSKSASAQTDVQPALVPGCDYSDSSLFDGFGWHQELNRSCAQVINQELGTAVEFTRVYWDGNADIANRTIQCDLYHFDTDQQTYQPAQSIYRNISHPSYTLEHLSIPPVAPLTGWKITRPTDQSAGEIREEIDSPRWSIEDGSYIGNGVLGSPFYELVETPNGKKAVRRWVNQFTVISRLFRDGSVSFPEQGYFDCYDISGADFIPTGAVDTPTTQAATLSNLEFSVAPNPGTDQPDQIFNLETGEAVELVKAHWNYNADIAGSRSCVSGEYRNGQYNRDFNKSVDHPYHFNQSDNRVYYRTGSGYEGVLSASGSYDVIDNILRYTPRGGVSSFAGEPSVIGDPVFTSDYVELFDGGVRLWQNSEYFEECYGLTPTGDSTNTGNTGNTDGTGNNSNIDNSGNTDSTGNANNSNNTDSTGSSENTNLNQPGNSTTDTTANGGKSGGGSTDMVLLLTLLAGILSLRYGRLALSNS